MKNRGFAILQSPGFCGVHFSFSPSFSLMDYDCRSLILFAFFFLFALRHFSLFKAPWPQNRCFSDKFPESSGRARQAESGEKSGKGSGKKDRERTGERMGNRTAGKGRERKEDRGKGKSTEKEQEWERKQGGGQTGRKEAPVFLSNFPCGTAQTKGCSG